MRQLLRIVTLVCCLLCASLAAQTAAPDPALALPCFPEVAGDDHQEEPKTLKPEETKFQWRSALLQSGAFMTLQHAAALAIYKDLRYKATHGPFFRDYFQSVKDYKFKRWRGSDPFLIDYVGHPYLGAVSGFIQIQNHPKRRGLEQSRSRSYLKSRLLATAWATAYSVQWELGPFSESSIENVALSTREHRGSDTGLVDFVVTPVGGMVWMLAEDALDKYAIRRLERVRRHPGWLATISLLNPARSLANLMRFKLPWYRDNRVAALARAENRRP